MHPIGKFCACLLACVSTLGSVATANAEPSAVDATVQQAALAVMQQYGIPGLAIALTVKIGRAHV